MGLANKELREAVYWLSLLHEAEVVSLEDLAPLLAEADELIAILTSSIRTAKQKDVEARAQ